MPTAAKIATVAELTEKLERSRAAVLLHYRELKVKEISDLRGKLRDSGVEIELKVAKNTLLRIAANNAGKPGLEGLFNGPTAVAFIYGEEPRGAKAVLDAVAAARKENVRVTGGILGAMGLDLAGVQRLTTMETREQQLSKLLGTMQSVASTFVATLNGAAQGLVYVLMALQEKLQEGGSAGSGATTPVGELIEAIGGLTIAEAVGLTEALETRFGVTAAAPTGGVAVAEAAVEAPVEAAAEPTEFTVMLTGFGASKLNVIKTVRELVPGLGLAEAKALVESAPKPIRESVDKDEAEKVRAKLAEAGASVEVQAVG